jgi:hypothetical protein
LDGKDRRLLLLDQVYKDQNSGAVFVCIKSVK